MSLLNSILRLSPRQAKILRWILLSTRGIFWASLTVVGLFSAVILYFLLQVPTDKQIKSCLTTSLHKIQLCRDSNDYVRLSQISPLLIKAVVFSEDGHFFSHHGFDYEEIEKSIKTDFDRHRLSRGGSTLSQQLVKNMFLTGEKSFSRKFLEAIITMRIERVLTKKEILEKYFNIVQFGKNIFGIGPAAEYYFKKKPADLNLLECIFLAFLLPNPEKYSISFSHKRLSNFAYKRMEQILEGLFLSHAIDDAEYESARLGLKDFFGSPSDGISQKNENSPEEDPGDLNNLIPSENPSE